MRDEVGRSVRRIGINWDITDARAAAEAQQETRLAQRESRIADLLGLCVEERDGVPHLHIAIIESKYVGADGAAEARRSSKAQLMATLSTA